MRQVRETITICRIRRPGISSCYTLHGPASLGYDQRYMPERKGFGLSAVLLFRRPGISSCYTLHGPASLLALQYVATRWLPREPKTPKSKNRS